LKIHQGVYTQEVQPGNIIKGSLWPEPIEIKSIKQTGNFVHIVGATTVSKKHIDQIIPISEIDSLVVLGKECNCCEEPLKVFLALETLRYRYASMYDPLLAMNTSKVDPLPHQIEAVYGYVLKLPRIRFLIADDPGAGKTIMAGLIIKELKLRNQASRILIVAPGHLKDQWRRELQERFKEHFTLIDRSILDAHFGENAWERENQIITSIDFAKREEILPTIASTRFDLIIVDEAHKMSAYKYGDETKKTDRYQMGEVLSRITEHMLFLTATPHRGDPENFRLFLDLLEPGFFATNAMLNESIRGKDNPLFIRRVKEDLKDFEGKPLFLPRHVMTQQFNLGRDSQDEMRLYNELSRYVNTEYNKVLNKDKKRNVAFALVILQRRLASSTFALLRSLERRKKRLEDLIEGAQEKLKAPNLSSDLDALEDLSEEDRWKEEEIWETLSVAENREDLKKEIGIIDQLISHSKTIIQHEDEIKLRELRDALKRLSSTFPNKPDRKILIFTESRDTLDYLERKIKEWGYSVNVIHGGMRLDDRINAEKVFKNETEVMVATEAAGEGINLQFCHMMINYDIPWNPNRLEQRMGRIHRYGQQKEVYVVNLVAEDTREGQVLVRLFAKLDEIKEAMGIDKVFDVLSELLYNTSLAQLLMDAAANARNIDEILKDLEFTVDEEYINKVKENLGETLATRFIDYTQIKEMAQRAREYRLIPEYTESYFKKAFVKTGGSLKERKNGGLTIETVSSEIKRVSERDAFKRAFGSLLKRYPHVVFDKEIAFKNPEAEFVSFGHPLFEAVMLWTEETYVEALRNGATFIDPDGVLDGYILFYEGEIRDGTLEIAGKRLFGYFTDGKNVTPIASDVIWDLAESNVTTPQCVEVEDLKNLVFTPALESLQHYQQELLTERNRQASIKTKYGEKSLEYLIYKLEEELITLNDRKERGEAVDLPIRNKELQKSGYQHALIDLKDLIKKETSLTMSAPHYVGIIRVQPPEHIGQEMRSDAEIERIGMTFVMEHERIAGRIPEDVSAQNLGFDIRSTAKDGSTRYIEVKARVETGRVALTQNEWFKAKRFKNDYYLYAVMNAGSSPQLYIIQNPVERIKAEERVDVVRYMIAFEEIQKVGSTQ